LVVGWLVGWLTRQPGNTYGQATVVPVTVLEEFSVCTRYVYVRVHWHASQCAGCIALITVFPFVKISLKNNPSLDENWRSNLQKMGDGRTKKQGVVSMPHVPRDQIRSHHISASSSIPRLR
jgi:hypothetical protein